MERLMQYVWQHRLALRPGMTTVDGRRLTVLDPGTLNTNSGPDFFNAKIRIADHTWVGDVEIHVRASDWHRHGHDGDPAYDSVVLHVVDCDNTPIHRSNGETIPQFAMKCEPEFHRRFTDLTGRAESELPCSAAIPQMPAPHLRAWLDALAFERVQEKAARISDILQRSSGDWETACYVTVARSLGFGANGDPFQRLAMSLPLRVVGRHSDSLSAIEALLFGQSGLLDEAPAATDGYVQRLRTDYAFFTAKFGLRAPRPMLWKKRMRPAGLPHRRIALLAAMLHGGFRMMSRILEITDLEGAVKLFTPTLTGYWTTHYNFSAPAARVPEHLSRASICSLAINTIVPLQWAFGTSHNDFALTDRAIDLLHSLPAENNTITDFFTRNGLRPRNAFDSQALIQLRNAYCLQRKCLYCRIGHRLLSAAALRQY